VSLARLLVFFTFVVAPAVWVGVTGGFSDAFWYVVLIGVLFWIGATLYDMFCAAVRWLNRPREITVRLYDQEEEVIDVEITAEEEYRKRRWWEEGMDNGKPE
jgi:hypothetical protein